MNKESEFIERLGGCAKVADVCEITRGAVWQWKKNGIPKSQLNFLKTRFKKEYLQIFNKCDD